VIPDEAVEDAAYVAYEVMRHATGIPTRYEDAPDDTKRIWRTIARAALEAAAPRMTASRIVGTKAELDALPIGSVLLDNASHLHRRADDDFAPWEDCDGGGFATVDLPATILHMPNV
jgi:hypothetical protein